LLLNFVFVSNFSIFAFGRSELRIVKWRLNLFLYGAHIQDILVLVVLVITEKNGAKFFIMYRRAQEIR
jgi:hypothetical protein